MPDKHIIAVLPTGDWCVVTETSNVELVTVDTETLDRLVTGDIKDGNELVKLASGNYVPAKVVIQ